MQYSIDRVWEELSNIYSCYFSGEAGPEFFHVYDLVFQACAFYGETEELLSNFATFISSKTEEMTKDVSTLASYCNVFDKCDAIFRRIADTLLFVGRDDALALCHTAFVKASESLMTSLSQALGNGDKDGPRFIQVLNVLAKVPEGETLLSRACEKLEEALQAEGEQLAQGEESTWDEYIKKIEGPLIARVQIIHKLGLTETLQKKITKVFLEALLKKQLKKPEWLEESKEENVEAKAVVTPSLLVHLFRTEQKLMPYTLLLEFMFDEEARTELFKSFGKQILKAELKSTPSSPNACFGTHSLVPLHSLVILDLLDERDKAIAFIHSLFKGNNEYGEDAAESDHYVSIFKASFDQFLSTNDEIGEELSGFIHHLLSGPLYRLIENVADLIERDDGLAAGFSEANVFLSSVLSAYTAASSTFASSYYAGIFHRLSMSHVLTKPSESDQITQRRREKLLEYSILLEKVVGEYMLKSDAFQTIESGRKTVRMIEDIEKSIEVCTYFNESENRFVNGSYRLGFRLLPTIIRRNIWRDQLPRDISEETLKAPISPDRAPGPLLSKVLEACDAFREWYRKDPSGVIESNKANFQHSIEVIPRQGWAKFKAGQVSIIVPSSCALVLVALSDYEVMQNKKLGTGTVTTGELRLRSGLPDKIFDSALSSLLLSGVLRTSDNKPLEANARIGVAQDLASIAACGEIVVPCVDAVDFDAIVSREKPIAISSLQAVAAAYCKEHKRVSVDELIKATQAAFEHRSLVPEDRIRSIIDKLVSKAILKRDGDSVAYLD